MEFPPFYDKDRVGSLYPPQTLASVEWGKRRATPPSFEDKQRTLLLLVDPQVDFIHPDGALSVPGAVADTRRTIEWIFRNLPRITTIAASLDSHIPIQIFFATWWEDANRLPPEPLTPISSRQVEAGEWRPIYEEDWSRQYVARLEEEAKKQLMIWPFHTLMGTTGHSMTPALYEAITYHAAARQTNPILIEKGIIAKTEFYSLLEPEIPVPEDARGQLNEGFLNRMMQYDSIFVAGQAKSHCVLETLTSIMRRYADQPQAVEKLHVLLDCTSSVHHPEIDFEKLANETLDAFQDKGLKLVDSTTPLD